MRKIKTIEELKKLKSSNVKDDYFLLIYKTFERLYKAMNDGEERDKFSLEKSGYIVILGSGDNLNDLSDIGLTEGLIKTTPEAVRKIKLDNFYVYQIEILTNNEFMLTVFIDEKSAKNEVKEWLENRL